jgi:tetraacyldisaccharide 4'-kinase
MLSAEAYRALVRGETRGLWPSLQRLGLWAVSVPYRWATRLRNGLYDGGWKRIHRAKIPVVSVGNLTLGGTGKTPCVEYVARHYRELDLRVAILSRGYGSRVSRNDEALVLQENLPDVPHLQGGDRVALAQRAVQELESEVLVLDDGFQHRRLARDLDLVLVDATEPWGQGYLFPRGLLRETPRGLRRAGVVVLTRCDLVEDSVRRCLRQRIGRFAPNAPVVETSHRPVELVNSKRKAPLELLRQRPLAAFCGIGNPEAFRVTLTRLGGQVRAFRTYPDHHAYTRTDVEDLCAWARQQEDGLVVTTQKDLVKLRLAQLGDQDLWALRIRFTVEAGQDVLERRLREVVSGSRVSTEYRR